MVAGSHIERRGYYFVLSFSSGGLLFFIFCFVL
nr:MAG TPA: hypothetical protein [Caudoviricetes sp.]